MFAEGGRFFVGCRFQVVDIGCTGCSERERFPQLRSCENGRESGRDKCNAAPPPSIGSESSSGKEEIYIYIYERDREEGEGRRRERKKTPSGNRGLRNELGQMVKNRERADFAQDCAGPRLVFIRDVCVHAVLSESFRCTSTAGSS